VSIYDYTTEDEMCFIDEFCVKNGTDWLSGYITRAMQRRWDDTVDVHAVVAYAKQKRGDYVIR
jgi:hypothetical protein